MSFWDSSFLWLEAVIAACAVGAACAVVGVYTILRRVVFLPAALSQVSGLGVMLACLVPTWFASLQGTRLSSAEWMASGITIVGSLLLGWMPEPRRVTRDAVIGIAFVLASALTIIISDRLPNDVHELKDVLFGNAVVVERGQMYVAAVVAALVLLTHGLMHRSFLLTSLDADTAGAHGVPARLIDGVLFLTIGVAIGVATKTIGALPVFAFSVLPGGASLMAFRSLKAVLPVAAVLGAASAFLGYWLSFTHSMPTGASMVVVAALFMVPGALVGLVRRRLA